MEMEASSAETGVQGRQLFATKMAAMAQNAKKLAKDDPRRVTHSLKVGLALILISIFYYLKPISKDFENDTIWAVMTVVVVSEFSVGATLGKGLNRTVATLLAGGLSVAAHYITRSAGQIAKPILLTFFVFLVAITATFFRFFPKIKKKYDYGVMIFLLTFSMVSVSGLRNIEDIPKIAYDRFSMILIGGVLCMTITITIWPVWAGEDLHNLIVLNMENLGSFLEGFGGDNITNGGGRSLQLYKSVLGSKSTEESLANFASWEPCHGKFRFRHPWQQYLKLGELIRQCAYRIEALHGHLNTDTNKTTPQIQEQIKETFKNISSETGKALKELSMVVKTMSTRQRNIPDFHLKNSRNAVNKLKALLKGDDLWKLDEDLLAIILSCGTVASLLIDIIECTEKVAEAVGELANLAKFKPINHPRVVDEHAKRYGNVCPDPDVVLTTTFDEPLHALP